MKKTVLVILIFLLAPSVLFASAVWVEFSYRMKGPFCYEYPGIIIYDSGTCKMWIGYYNPVIKLTALMTLPWLFCFYAVNNYRTKKLKNYWWVFLSLPILLWRILELLLVYIAWSISGFAP